MTNSLGTLERAVMISSVIPSQRNSCFGSSLMFTNGSTATEGTSGKGKAIFSLEAGSMGGGRNNKFQTITPMSTMRPATAPAKIGLRRQAETHFAFATL